MAGFIVLAVLIVACFSGYLVWLSSQIEPVSSEPPPSEAELLQARLDLCRIERGVDVALAKEEAHLHAQQTKQAIAEALENGR